GRITRKYMITKISTNGMIENRNPSPPPGAWAKAGVTSTGNSLRRVGKSPGGEAARDYNRRMGESNRRSVDTVNPAAYVRPMTITPPTSDALSRIADALERISPPPAAPGDLGEADAFVWNPGEKRLVPVPRVNRVDLGLLKGID